MAFLYVLHPAKSFPSFRFRKTCAKTRAHIFDCGLHNNDRLKTAETETMAIRVR